MRRMILIVVVAGLVSLVLGMVGWSRSQGPSGQGSAEQRAAAAHTVYFGWLLGTKNIAAVAIDVEAPDAKGRRAVRAYVCDGLGFPAGMAVWFLGSVNPRAVNQSTQKVAVLPSASRREKLSITHLSAVGVSGTFTDARGRKAHFFASRAVDGAGIYEVSLDEKLHYKGISTDGAKLDAQADRKGTTRGTITTAGGKKVTFRVQSLALAPVAALNSYGLSPDYRRYVAHNQIPGEYVAVIAPGGSHWLGRSGNVRGGKPGAEIIGLDKKC